MNILGYRSGRAKLLSITFFTASCIVDHMTTLYGLSLPNVKEINPVVLLLIGSGIWNLVDFIFVAAVNGSGLVIFGSKSKILIELSITALLIFGIIRLCAGVNNLVVIFNTLRMLALSS